MSNTEKSGRSDGTVTDSFMTNEDESDELFSDDEQGEEINYKSDVSLDVSILRSKTPLLLTDNSNSVTPSEAVIPSTPLSLVPFLNKINEQWTSDLETPQADKTAQLHTKPSTSVPKNTGETSKLEPHTPDTSSAISIDNKITSDSPVIVPRVVRKRLKRRCIFQSSISTDMLAETSNEYTTVSKQEAASIAESDTILVVQGNATNVPTSIPHNESAHEDNKSQSLDRVQEMCDNKNISQLRDSVPDVLDLDKEFFNDTCFSIVDKLVSSNLDEQTTVDTTIQGNDKQGIANIHRKGSQTLNLNSNRVEENDSVGFVTARGTAINVSKEALLKAKTLLADEMRLENHELPGKKSSTERNSKHLSLFSGISPELQAARKHSKNYDEVHVQDYKRLLVNEGSVRKDHMLPFSSSTASGHRSNVSGRALPRVKLSFMKELDEPLESKVAGETVHDKENKLQEINNPNVGFQTARGAPINISKQALSRAKSLFAKELDEPLEINITEEVEAVTEQKAKELDEPLELNVAEEANVPNREIQVQEATSNFGFQTARGAPVNISKQALSKAKLRFAKELDVPLELNDMEEANVHNREIKVQEAATSNIGFQTARGAPINISEQALSKAKLLFAKEFEPNVAEEVNTRDKEVRVQEATTSKVGFQTARGTPVNVSKQALSGAKLLFAKELDGPLGSNVAERASINNEAVKGQGVIVPDVGFRTARGAAIGISEQAFSKAQALFADQLDSPVESNLPEKRKLSSDDSTPLGRGFASGWKKMRLNNEFEGRKLFADTADQTETPSKDLRVACGMSADDDPEDGRTEASRVAEFPNEIVEANHAARPDERSQIPEVSTADFSLRSPQRNTSELPESDAMCSPVIGRQPVSRKRWSLERHRRKHGTSQTAPGNAAPRREKTDEEESSLAESQRVTERQKTESESTEYGDTQMMMDFIDESAQILQDRLAAALEQEETITGKRRRKSKQSTGYLYRHKQANSGARVSLRDLGAPPSPRSYQELIDQRIPPNILPITASTAASYKFRCSDFYGNDVARSNVRGIELEDGARLVMDENGYVGVWEFLRAFLASPGVEPNLVPARWIENHYRWIVWKLASMDRMKFGSAELPRALTPSHVMAQLKYRYDREIDRSQRPAIRRILEKDDVASKRMILCVSSIVENNTVATPAMEMGKSPRIGVPKWRIELTDGWYSIPACIDIGMAKNVSTGKMREGTKLLVCGAELLNCNVACYPLEAPADVCLKLHTNSTRRARWYSKLGYTPRSGPIPVRLHDVCPTGGFIGKLTIVVARMYPMLYHEKTASGESVVRNAKGEEKAQIEYEQRCRQKAEAFYDKAEKDFQEEDLSCETDLLTAGSGKDRESDTQKQQDELLRALRVKKERYKQELQSKLRESLPAPRQVSSLLKVRVCDGNANAILSVWSPGEEVIDALKEGACVSLRNVVAAGKRGCELQLTARRCALFDPGTMRDPSYPARVCASFHEVGNPEFSPPYGEFDTVGLVCAVGTAPYGMKDFEVVHLAYPKADSSRSSLYLSILFWQGIASYGYADILTVGCIVACNNLEWRRVTSWNVPAVYCTDKSTFTRNPRRNHLYESFETLRSSIADPIAYAEGCTAELNVELQRKPVATRTPTRCALDKNTPIKIYNSAPGAKKRPVEHTPPLSAPRSTANNSWNLTTNIPLIQKRLDKLQYYGEPPELSPIVIRSSKRVSLDFQSPVRVSDASPTTDVSNVSKSSSSLCLSLEKR
ncbi:PREDICTED: breast cancer type 2 susceptibility protein homolog isoform X2 [Dinoponera quadriceps]|uniref:Breast cancer type 2 susceptibility protein homolog isoform X2 n=1 Tax=Dinoponera quadriceps TaxID=609295 RepID=A0A6P3Y064_DINQU|nr:PREDICTED: breast cancer type 2 susceptibility protein homolog isoform X2 [Dinoponera quadriceps]